MRLKGLVSLSLMIFATSVVLILFVGLVLVPPGTHIAGFGVVGTALPNSSDPSEDDIIYPIISDAAKNGENRCAH